MAIMALGLENKPIFSLDSLDLFSFPRPKYSTPPSRILNQSSSESDSGWTHSSRPHFLVPNILAPRFLNQTSDESETERAPKTAVEASCVRRPPHLVSNLWTMATNLGASKPETHMKEAGRVRGGGRISPPPLTLIRLHLQREVLSKT